MPPDFVLLGFVLVTATLGCQPDVDCPGIGCGPYIPKTEPEAEAAGAPRDADLLGDGLTLDAASDTEDDSARDASGDVATDTG